jgi:hypothetical protein
VAGHRDARIENDFRYRFRTNISHSEGQASSLPRGRLLVLPVEQIRSACVRHQPGCRKSCAPIEGRHPLGSAGRRGQCLRRPPSPCPTNSRSARTPLCPPRPCGCKAYATPGPPAKLSSLPSAAITSGPACAWPECLQALQHALRALRVLANASCQDASRDSHSSRPLRAPPGNRAGIEPDAAIPGWLQGSEWIAPIRSVRLCSG